MSDTATVDPLRAVRAALDELSEVRLAVAFGSLARGGGGPLSDLDVALRLEPDSGDARRRIEAAITRAAGRETDFVYVDEAPPLLRFQIARDGVVLLERSPRLWARFKARAMIDWWDWAPTARRIHATYVRNLKESLAHG